MSGNLPPELTDSPRTGCRTHPSVRNPFCQTCCDHATPEDPASPFDRYEREHEAQHSGIVHDIYAPDDPRPMCCVDGCDCGKDVTRP